MPPMMLGVRDTLKLVFEKVYMSLGGRCCVFWLDYIPMAAPKERRSFGVDDCSWYLSILHLKARPVGTFMRCISL